MSLRERLLTRVIDLETERNSIAARVTRLDGMVSKLKLLLEGDEDLELDAILQAAAQPQPPVPVPQPPPPPPPPPRFLGVTREQVILLTQSFEDEFETNDLVLPIAKSQGITDPVEIKRARAAVSQMLDALIEKHYIVKTQVGVGRRRAKFRRQDHRDFHVAEPHKGGAHG